MITQAPQALLSIHDVMPDTLDDVQELLDLCAGAGVSAPSLLIVPGLSWTRAELQRIQEWERAGSELIAHGWTHFTKPKRLYHRLHSALISRDVAEHLDLDQMAVLELMQRSFHWFKDNDLQSPETYIPPAWALGIKAELLMQLPFRYVETLGGVYHVTDQVQRIPLPLIGFEADTRFRALCLRAWNAREQSKAGSGRMPLRISVHPRDHRLRLQEDLRRALHDSWRFLKYRELARARE
ncbi:MAG: polysaccharide deacetylase family protein [Pseudomonadota bacterium]